ncbi:hypothetical protein [Streptomyces sp. NBC_01216]|uniref:hypothetical protein n=1 Tax=unclassified Streptomyces TaxID=2593676 RepID=UPI002E166105|nr:hypothetical protein OG393_12670 [Streptomyces sp. NBC_01216]
MAYGDGRVVRACHALLAGALVLTGCAAGGADRDDGRNSGTTGASPTARAPGTAAVPSAPPSRLDFTPDPSRAPANRADAERLALRVVAGPDAWGPGYVRRTPYVSDPEHWPVLRDDCVWDRGTPPASVLYSVTASSQVPATAGKGLLRVSATVTVHRTEEDGDWEMAGTLEEALRCPNQTLREGERLTGLNSLGNPFGVGGNYTASDSLGERGAYENDAVEGRYFYSWYQSRIGQVTVATVVKGAPGYVDGETDSAQIQALVTMIERVKAELKVQS